MVDIRKTEKELRAIAKNYSTKSEFREKELSVVRHLEKLGKEVYASATAHMIYDHEQFLDRKKYPQIDNELRHKIKEFIEKIKKENEGNVYLKHWVLKNDAPLTKYEIQKLWGSYIYFAQEFGIADKSSKARLDNANKTYEDCLEIAKSCDSWAKFIEEHLSIYDFAKYRGWRDKLKQDSKIKIRKVFYNYTDEELIAQANKHNSMIEFRKNDGGLFQEIYRRNLSRSLKFEIQTKYADGIWDFEACKALVESGLTRIDINRDYGGAHTRIYKEGWHTKLFTQKQYSQIKSNVLYFWNSLELPDVWKIGKSSDTVITKYTWNNTRWLRRIQMVSEAADLTIDKTFSIPDDNCSDHETEILKSYPSFEFGKSFDGCTEFLHLTDEQVIEIVNKYDLRLYNDIGLKHVTKAA
jgi:hypothetical protein